MGYEIDFLPVGEESRSGDAIAMRFGDLLGGGGQYVVVIDGGFQKDGEALVEHIREYYQTETVDLVVSTHPDADHINGLSEVLEEMNVKKLWMHRPSARSRRLESLAKRIENKKQQEAFRKAIQSATDLESQADAAGIPIEEPFTGLVHESGALGVVGPSREFYDQALERALEQPSQSAVQRFFEVAKEAVSKVAESWDIETLTDEGETSPINNTSAVIMFSHDDRHKLFTADAGIPALEKAADALNEIGLGGDGLSFVQVPHHGSKRNVGPTVLDRLLGGKKAQGEKTGVAYVSAAPKGEPKHPAKKVTNAFRRRGYPVHTTQGTTTCHSYQSPNRSGWSASKPVPFYNEVEE